MSALVRVVLLGFAMAVAAAVAVYHLSEARRLHARLAHLSARERQLEGDLADSIRQSEKSTQLLAAAVEAEQVRRAQQEARIRAAQRPPPEGVRLALIALNECLREDGFDRLRCLSGRWLTGAELGEVELIERDDASLGSVLYVCGRLRLRLDREAGALTLVFLDGHRLVGGEREEFPAAGLLLRLHPVEGPMWEARLGYLVESSGRYPLADAARPPPGQLDLPGREAWLARISSLLEHAESGDLSYRIEGLSGLHEGVFRGVMMLGYDRDDRLAMAVEAKRMSVCARPQLGVVELLLEEGVLRKAGGETTIPAAGYRIVLPSVSREDAVNTMLGMVLER